MDEQDINIVRDLLPDAEESHDIQPEERPKEMFSDRFMEAFVNGAKRASVETDLRSRELQVAALTANGLVRLAVSDLIDEDLRKSAALLFAHLVTDISLDIQELNLPQAG